MYSWFYIKENVWNNSFAEDIRIGRQLYVPSLINWIIDNLKIWNEIVFEESDENWKIISFKWLENFIKTELFWIPTYIFDNHNHAFYFWFEEIIKWRIKTPAKLIHIDEHSDMREPRIFLEWNYLEYSEKQVFEYTNYVLNVWDYIKPAIKLWMIWDIIKIQWEENLRRVEHEISSIWEYILNLDIDFFSPEMSYINFDYAKKIIINLAKNAQLITIATSPFFINQNRAIEIIKALLV